MRSSRLPAVLLLSALCAAGCTREEYDGRVAVSGAVTRDGAPVTVGRIRFAPARGSSGPSAGGDIENGRYNIAAVNGPGYGEYTVTVTAGEPPSRQRFGRDQKPAADHATAEFSRLINRPDDHLDFELRSGSPPPSGSR